MFKYFIFKIAYGESSLVHCLFMHMHVYDAYCKCHSRCLAQP